MRLGLIDLLFAVACIAIGVMLGPAATGLPAPIRPFAGPVAGIGIYLALVYPLYRGLRWLPIIIPRCPCCRTIPHGFDILGGSWPRVIFRCPLCNGEFVVWYNGTPDDQETWERPVLALKWPYAFGRYRRLQRPSRPKD